MEDEANALAPNRNRKADGSIGDTAHSNRTSDHNPAPDGYVYALDLTHAPASGFDAHARARLLVGRRDRRLKYVISDRMIARGYDKPGIPAWTWTPYTGPNPHTFHAHFSVDAAFRNDTRPWWGHIAAPPPPPPPREDDDTMWDYINDCYSIARGIPLRDLNSKLKVEDRKGRRYWFRTFSSRSGAELGKAMESFEHGLGLL